MIRCTYFGLVILFCTPFWGFAETFKVIDEDGNVTFTDAPKQDEDAEVVELPSINTIPKAQTIPLKPSNNEAQDINPAPSGYDVTITSPLAGTEILADQRSLAVAFATIPVLHFTHFARLFMDGKPVGDPIQGTSFVIEEIYRGEHRLQVVIVSASGELIAQSAPVSVLVFRPIVKR